MTLPNFIAACLLLATAGCATFVPPPERGSEPRLIEARGCAKPDCVALVLSGGSARGFAHVGVIKALEANGLRPDIVVGTSAGAMVGALYASGLSADEMVAAMGRLDRSVFQELSLPGLGVIPGSLGLLRADSFHRFIDREARHRRMEDFPMRFAVLATDMNSGEPKVFNTGDVGTAVAAAGAVPGLFAPVQIAGRLYGDGALSSPLPVQAARSLGARTVIAVDVIYPPEDAGLTSAMRVIFQAFAISVHRLKQYEAANADVLITPSLGRTSGQWGFSERDRLIAAGEAAVLSSLPRLRAAIQGQQRP